MRKIVSLFQRNYDGDRLVRNEIVPGAEWVLDGEGTATRKFDGTCCLVRDGKLLKRYDAKQGKTPPPDFEPAQDYDPMTGHMPGWVPVGDSKEDQWHRDGLERTKTLYRDGTIPDGTYELIGPKIQGNPEHAETHYLVRHGMDAIPDCPRDYSGLRAFLATQDIEGVVWHHPDGRMVKIKGKDFGLKRSKKEGA